MFDNGKILAIMDNDSDKQIKIGEFSLNSSSDQNGLNSTVKTTEAWGCIIQPGSFTVADRLDYPIDGFPQIIKEAIEAISEYVQAPIAMAAQCVLGTISHIAQGKVNAPNFSLYTTKIDNSLK